MDPFFNSFDYLFEKPQDSSIIEDTSIQNPINKQNESKNFKPLPDLSKLKPFLSYKKNIILLLFGSFYPIHNNHLRTLNIARSFIESSNTLKQELNIMGGFIMPTHFNSLKKKIGKPLLEDSLRIEFCKLAVIDSDWINILPFLSLQKTNIGIYKAKKFLTDYINCNIGKKKKRNEKIFVVSVFGDDNLEIVEKQISQKRELFVIVQNRPNQTKKDLKQWFNSDKIKPFQDKVIIVIDEKMEYELSSIMIRKILNNPELEEKSKVKAYLPSKVYQLILDKNITFPVSNLFQKPTILSDIDIKPIENSFEKLVGFEIKNYIQFSELIASTNPQKLGQGLQASVFSMIWKKPDSQEQIPVAVKITDFSTDRGRKLKAYIRDLRALLLCNHHNVVHFYGAGLHETKLYLVMEKGIGLNTWNFIQEQRKTWENKSKIPRKWFKCLAELAEGLQNMADNGILHRDLQLNNIVVFEQKMEKIKEESNGNFDENTDYNKKIHEESKINENKEIELKKNLEKNDINEVTPNNSSIDYRIKDFEFKLCDFGVSALESDKHLVVRGSTRHYSPEAIEDKMNYVSASDVYSFGNLLFEIVNARKTFIEYSVEEMQVKVKRGERPKFMKGSDQRLNNIIEKCWEQDWRKRPSFSDVAISLHNIYKETLE